MSENCRVFYIILFPKKRALCPNIYTVGLGLIVVKPGERSGCKNRNIQLEEMIKVRKIILNNQQDITNNSKRSKKDRDSYPFDLNKVVLGAKFDDNDKNLHLSAVILDKVKSFY